MKQIFLIFLLLTAISHTAYSQNGWYQQNSTAAFNLQDVEFINASTGFILELKLSGSPYYTKIYKTTDGGQNWTVQYTLTNIMAGTIQFINSTTGFIGGSNFYRTTNAGISWDSISAIPHFARDIYFVNENTGWTASSGSGDSRIYKTINSGISWMLQYVSPFGYGMRSVFFTSDLTGYVTGITSSDYLFKTTNGGTTWAGQGASTIPGNSLFFVSANTGYNAGENSLIHKTTNAGATWAAQQSPVPGVIFTSVYFVNANTGFICGGTIGSAIIKTTNGGVSWAAQTYPGAPHLNSIFFLNETTGYSVGENGVILKTTTGGITAITPLSDRVPEKFSLSQNYPNPFNPTTHLRFGISELRFVELIIYDILGKEVATLVNEQLQPGTYEVEWDASNYSSGVYYYRIVAGEYSETKKMTLMK